MKKLMFFVLFLFSVIAYGEPSTKDIASAVNSNNYKSAEQMINEVITNHPKSAKAHYFKSQILEKENKRVEAQQEFGVAMTLDPAGSFTDGSHLSAYKATLAAAPVLTTVTSTVASTNSRREVSRPYRSPGINPYISVLIIVLIILLISISIYYLFIEPMRIRANNTQFSHSLPYSSNMGSVGAGVYFNNGTSPTIINANGVGGSSNGLVTGMVLGSMMNHNGGGYGGYNRYDDFSGGSSSSSSTETTTKSTTTETSPSFSFDSGSGGSSSDSSWNDSSSSSSSSSYDSGSSDSSW